MKALLKSLILSVSLTTCSVSFAQLSLSPTVSPTQGGNYIAGSVDLSWTMGETFTPTLEVGSNILSQGFMQPEIDILSVTTPATACQSGPIAVAITTAGFVDPSNVFTAQMSDATGSFSSAVNIGTLTSTSASTTISADIPLTTAIASGYKIRVVSSNPVFMSKPSAAFAVINCVSSYTWTGGAPGNTNNDWSVATNWSPNGIPNSCLDDVTIPVTTLKPVVSSPVSARNVAMADGAQLTLNADLSVCGTWTGGTSSNAVVGGTTGAVVLTGSTTHVISAKTSFNELKLNNTSGGATMSGASVDVFNYLDLQKGNFNTTGGTFTLKSVSPIHAGVIDNFSYGSTPGTFTGTINAERYYNASATYTSQHFIGSPVNTPSFSQFGATAGTSGFVTPYPDCDEQHLPYYSLYGKVFSYHEYNGAACGTAQWKVETAGNTQNGVGYSVVLSGTAGTLSINGTPNLNSSYTVNGLVNSGWPTHQSLQHHNQESGWQLMANPYPAPMEIRTLNAGFDAQIQIWDPGTGTYTVGIIPTVGNPTSSAFIAPFQSFMVHVSTGVGSGNFTINGTDRVRTLHTYFSQQANELKIAAQNTANNSLDNITVAFNQNATAQFDPLFDADKFAGSLNRHTIYTLNNDKWMAINTLHSIAETSTVPMGFEPGATGSYSLSFDGVNTFDASSYITLEDKAANVMHDVRNGGPYSFTADSADDWNRFVLHFTPPVEVTAIDAGCNTQGLINIAQPGTAHWNYTITDNNNATIAQGTIDQSSPISMNANAGSYTLILTDNSGYTVTKPIQVNGVQAVLANFTVSANTIPEQQNITVQSTTPGAVSYQWNFGNGTTATGQSVTMSYTSTGIYNIVLVVTDQNGCSATSTQVVSVTHLATTGINNVANDEKIEIWSNENRVYVDFTAMPKVDAIISIFNVLGQEICNDKFTNNTVYTKEIDNIEAAYMMVRVKDADRITTKKVLIVNTK